MKGSSVRLVFLRFGKRVTSNHMGESIGSRREILFCGVFGVFCGHLL